MKKALSVLLILLSILVLTLTGCVHTCDNVCPECNKCLDSECSDKVCADKCEGHEVAHSHTLSEVPEVKATCTKSGTKGYYVCSGCDKLFADAEGKTEIEAPEAIEKIAHSFTNYVSNNDATCTADGTKTAKCDNCDATDKIADKGSKKSHTEADAVKENEIPATCTTDGSYDSVVRCSVCSEEISRETKTISAKGHSYGEVSYSWSDDNSTCTATRVCANDASHVETETVNSASETTPATCTADGKTVYTASFTNSAFETQTTESVIEAKNHSYGAVSYSWSDDKSTCTATRVCANDANHVETETVNSTSETTPATCTADGKTVYTASFTNSAFETQTTESVIEAKNHSYGAVSYSWSDDKSTCTATRVCANDANHIETETVNSTSATTPATCIAEGKIVYAADFTNDAFETQTEETILGMIEHTPADAVKENIENATCAKDGSYDLVVYCSVENCKHEISREKFTVKATGEHVYATEQEKVAATCTVDGYVIMACGCGATEKTTISATGHEYESKVTAPTCTEAGFTTYTCSVCGDNYTADEVDALGHSYEAVVTAPTCTEAGFTTYTCSVCGDSYTADELAALGHSYEAVVTAPTCTEAGFTTYTCSVCGDSYTADEVAALGHNWTGYELVTAPTYESTGILGGTCANCDAPTYELPVVSAENGYTKLVSGVATIWKYTFNDFDVVFAIANKNVETKETAFMVKDNDPFAEENGGSIVGNIDKSSDGLHYQNNYGNTFTAKVYSSDDTTVKFVVKLASKSGRAASLKGLFSSLTVNGESVVINEGSVTGAGWGTPVNAVVALISLKEGENTISFTRTGSNNFNIWGIGVIADANDIIIDLDPITGETLKTQTFRAFVNDPFIAANGGSISGTVSVTNDTPRYQNTQGQTFTATITVSEDTVADFIIKVENGSQTNTYAGLFSSITLDGVAVTINDGSVTGKGWGRSIDIVVASLNLTKGTHVITFTRTSDTGSANNFNIWGIGFIIPNKVDITLGSAE